MRAILKKTVGPNFRAGDVIRGENYRIKRLEEKGLVTRDHSLLAMFGNIFGMVMAFAMIVFSIMSFVPMMQRYLFEIPTIWSVTFIMIGVTSFSMNMAYFLNAKKPYVTYFVSFITNIFGGIMIMAGHERMAAKYQPKTMSASAGVTILIIGSLLLAIATLAVVDANMGILPGSGLFTKFGMWGAFLGLYIIGIILAIFFDADYTKRRLRYIGFIKRKNAKIAYKQKAINLYKAYQKTGNADKFMEKNIELLEATLGVDQKDNEIK